MTVLSPSVIMSLSWQVSWYTTAGFIIINAARWLQKIWPEWDKTKPAASSPFIYSHLKGGFVHNWFPLKSWKITCHNRGRGMWVMEWAAIPAPPRKSLPSPSSPLISPGWIGTEENNQHSLTPLHFHRINTEMRQPARSVVESALRVQNSSRNGEERVLVSTTGKTEPKFRSITLFLHRI